MNSDNISIFHDFIDILEVSGLGTWHLVDEECCEVHFFDIYGSNLSVQFSV